MEEAPPVKGGRLGAKKDPAGRFPCVRGAEQGTDNSGTVIHFRFPAEPRVQAPSPVKAKVAWYAWHQRQLSKTDVHPIWDFPI